MRNTQQSFFRQRSFILLLKGAVFIFLAAALYKQLFIDDDFRSTWNYFTTDYYPLHHFGFILLVVLMMPLNWFIEARKWQLLVSHVEKINFFTAVKAVFSGVTFSVFTPNRIGEFAGRIIFLNSKKVLKPIAITFIGTLAQLTATAVFGIIAVVFYIVKHEQLPHYFNEAIIFFVMLFALGILFLYFNLQLVFQLFQKIKFLNRWSEFVKVLSEYTRKELFNFIFLSFLRYGIFMFQYVLLLKSLGLPISFSNGFLIVPIIYLVQTILPTITILEPGLRSNVALFFLSPFIFHPENKLAIVAAAIGIWFINLIVPALIGSIFIFSLKRKDN